ncbi:MAG: hypothetical protein ACI977_000647 [Candidatus Nanohaloarchaea archaeon]|jgi:hypothetical protein
MRSLFKLLGLLVASLAALTVIIIALTLTLLLAIGFMFSGLGSEPSHIEHEVEYNAQIHTNGTLNDTRILLPYPQDDRFIEAVNTNSTNVSIHNEFNTSLEAVNTSKGVFLELDMHRFQPEKRSRGLAEINDSKLPEKTEVREVNHTGIDKYKRYDLSIAVKYNRSLDTRRGLENEPHLRSNSTECRSYEENCATTEAFLQYDTGNETYLDMDVRIDGRNSWASGFSWSSNSYSQSFYSSYYDNEYIKGSQDTWLALTGVERQEEGTYREE